MLLLIGLEVTTLMDLSRIQNKMRLMGLEPHLPSFVQNQVLRPMDVDLRAVVTWDTDLSNVEVHSIGMNSNLYSFLVSKMYVPNNFSR